MLEIFKVWSSLPPSLPEKAISRCKDNTHLKSSKSKRPPRSYFFENVELYPPPTSEIEI